MWSNSGCLWTRAAGGRSARTTQFAVHTSPIDGLGLFATQALSYGQCLGRFTGRVMCTHERRGAHPAVPKSDRLIELRWGDGWCVVDTRRADAPFEFVNSSQEPNLHVSERGWVTVVAEDGVESGEELTWDYRFNGVVW